MRADRSLGRPMGEVERQDHTVAGAKVAQGSCPRECLPGTRSAAGDQDNRDPDSIVKASS